MHHLLSSCYKNIPGVTKIDSGIPGKNIAIIALTHGNEPAGLLAQEAVYTYLQETPLLKGAVYLITVNHEAYKASKRFIQYNMNRIVGQENNKEIHDSYEYKRYKEIEIILDEVDVSLDIHSTTKEAGSLMGICNPDDLRVAQAVLHSDRLLIDPEFDTSGSLSSLMTTHGKVGLGIECGSHLSDDAKHNALQNCYNLLSNYGLITHTITAEDKPVYIFHEEVFPKTVGFTYTTDRNNFDTILPGESYATDGEYSYTNTQDHPLYIGLVGKNPIPGDGVCFLFRKEQ